MPEKFHKRSRKHSNVLVNSPHLFTLAELLIEQCFKTVWLYYLQWNDNNNGVIET